MIKNTLLLQSFCIQVRSTVKFFKSLNSLSALQKNNFFSRNNTVNFSNFYVSPVCHTNLQQCSIRSFAKESSRNSKKQKKLSEKDEEDEEDSDSDEVPESEYFDRSFEEDKMLPFNFRERKHKLGSLRIDSIISLGLNISKSKVTDLLLASKIKLNDRRVLKKSTKIKEGDYVDVTMVDDNKARVKRVRVLGVVEGDGGNFEVYLRSWRGGIDQVGCLQGGNWK